jgi:glycerol kinase
MSGSGRNDDHGRYRHRERSLRKTQVVVALDIGSAASRAMAFSKTGEVLAQSQSEYQTYFPGPGWVEQDALEIWEATHKALREVLSVLGADPVATIGMANQRETTLLWNRSTGQPLYRAIAWQCRRTVNLSRELSAHSRLIKHRTGLFLDPYFSATKIRWILDNVAEARRQVENGEAIFGTVDSWILWNVTGRRVHATDPSNAARTLCFNIHALDYDDDLLRIFGLPRFLFPQVKDSAGLFGATSEEVTGPPIPIMGILGDQNASLFAQEGVSEHVVKNTYGTGLFLMTSTGESVPASGRLVNTIAWKLGERCTYALEGSMLVGGSGLQWLKDQLQLIGSFSEAEKMAASLDFNEGVYFVPALVGLGAPAWDPDARGLFMGLTQNTTRQHLARAAQTRDVMEELKRVAPTRPFRSLRGDGQGARVDLLMQFQADILNMPVERPAFLEATALGAAGAAGLAAGFWTQDEFFKVRKVDRTFIPRMEASTREALYRGWKKAMAMSVRREVE